MKSLTPEGIVLVTGGAASGKSALAESICCLVPGKRVYIATMEPHGPEAPARIARHRELRAGKGFDTVECYRDLIELELPGGCAVALLEDLGNLAANHLFGARTDVGAAGVVEQIIAGLDSLSAQVGALVIVHNEVFAGAERYGGDMAVYLEIMGKVAGWTARRASAVIESVCGLPLVIKGEPLC